MSVITDKERDVYQRIVTPKCSGCKATTHYPFLEWMGIGDTDIYLCARCCKIIKPGLTADLIQIGAIRELVEAGYSRHTLVRTS